MSETVYRNGNSTVACKAPEARYAYYRRCREFKKNGEQCKAPAMKGAHICYSHAGQRELAERRDAQRRGLLEEVVRRMRSRGRPEFQTADVFMDFNAIQMTLAVMAQALIDGRIDCKTAGRLAVVVQMAAKLLRLYHRGHRGARKTALTTKDTKDHKGKPEPVGREGRNGTSTTHGAPGPAEARRHGEASVSRCAAGLDGSTRGMPLTHHDKLKRGGLQRRAAFALPLISTDDTDQLKARLSKEARSPELPEAPELPDRPRSPDRPKSPDLQELPGRLSLPRSSGLMMVEGTRRVGVAKMEQVEAA
ncbi:MAG: hypothetical protein LAO20_04940 [Acidobacteriia bacterium]|nr:hypothetical protein [Terriglobia bacterium]